MLVVRNSARGSLAPRPHVPAIHLVSKLQVYPRHILREDCRPGAISYPDELQTSQYGRWAGVDVVDGNWRGFTLPSTRPS